ncbi:hypothetical protein ABK040_007723 [Willaertia magna]
MSNFQTSNSTQTYIQQQQQSIMFQFPKLKRLDPYAFEIQNEESPNHLQHRNTSIYQQTINLMMKSAQQPENIKIIREDEDITMNEVENNSLTNNNNTVVITKKTKDIRDYFYKKR